MNKGLSNLAQPVGAVIVIYFPEEEMLDRLLRALAPQVTCMVVVDNGALESTRSFLQGLAAEIHSLKILRQSQNVGIAAAHNVGIAQLRIKGCTHILLLDQDSIPALDMVDKLLQVCLQLQAEGKQVAAVGPGYQDPCIAHGSFFVRFAAWLLTEQLSSSGEQRLIDLELQSKIVWIILRLTLIYREWRSSSSDSFFFSLLGEGCTRRQSLHAQQ